jgi:hypothetical protein
MIEQELEAFLNILPSVLAFECTNDCAEGDDKPFE